MLEKPPTPKHSRTHHHHHKNNPSSTTNNRSNNRNSKQEVDTTSTSDCCDAPKTTKNHPNNDDDSTSDLSLNIEHGRSRKKLFSRLKSSSTSRLNNNVKTRKSPQQQQQRSCSPVENLRRQLQKLEDLEDQFPQQSDTYHLRYPFSDGQKFEGSSELEFFRHRIHLERDSIKRAKESLRSQKMLFQQRQKELKLKHGTMARHTLQQLCQVPKSFNLIKLTKSCKFVFRRKKN